MLDDTTAKEANAIFKELIAGANRLEALGKKSGHQWLIYEGEEIADKLNQAQDLMPVPVYKPECGKCGRSDVGLIPVHVNLYPTPTAQEELRVGLCHGCSVHYLEHSIQDIPAEGKARWLSRHFPALAGPGVVA